MFTASEPTHCDGIHLTSAHFEKHFGVGTSGKNEAAVSVCLPCGCSEALVARAGPLMR